MPSTTNILQPSWIYWRHSWKGKPHEEQNLFIYLSSNFLSAKTSQSFLQNNLIKNGCQIEKLHCTFLCWSRRARVRHTWWRTKRSWPLFSPTFFFFFFFFLFLFLRLLLFTHFGESPVRENLFPPIFWHN